MRVFCLSVALLLVVPASSRAQHERRLETVLPLLPGKNQVRWYEFDWKYTDFTPMERGAPVRLYFYASEREIARTAQPLIARAYVDYARTFGYVPAHRTPFLLYNSHLEFESTQAFFVSEGVLGVTSTTELTMALPYWGEHLRFEHVMRHELAHQFTIQKVVDLDRAAGNCGALQRMPLWFVEGLAETVSQPALTPEVRAALADRLLPSEPDVKPKGLPDFFDVGLPTFENVYLMGHARVRFLEKAYGEGTVRRLLQASPELCAGAAAGFFATDLEDPFTRMVERVVGTDGQTLDTAWKEWATKQVQPSLDARQRLVDLPLVEGLGRGEVDSFSLSPDGRVLLYRTIDLDTGVGRLYLQDVGDPSSRVLVTGDQRIGLVSLHPGGRRVTAVGKDMLAFFGRVADSDALYVRRYAREEKGGRVHLRLLEERRHELDRYGLLEGGFPAIAPDGAVAFVGLPREQGFLDIYRMETPFRANAPLVRVTADAYAEQALAYGADGALVYASDATPDAHFALFRWKDGRTEPLLFFPGGVHASAPSADDGGWLFEATASGLVQAYRLQDGTPVRLTDVPTSFSSPARDADGRLLGLVLVRGSRRLVAFPKEQLVAEPAAASPIPPVPGERPSAELVAWAIPRGELTDVQDYKPLALRNFRLVDAFAAATGGPFIVGQVAFANQFRTHIVGLSLQILGDLDLTNAQLLYLDRSRRTALGGGLLVRSSLQLEGDPAVNLDTFVLQRLGGLFLVEYPFGQYVRVGGFVSPQLLRTAEFSNPLSPLAKHVTGVAPAAQVGAELAVDTLRLASFGPYDGVAFVVRTDATVALGPVEPFGTVSSDLFMYKNVLSGFERLFLRGRLGVGTTLGGPLRESFYLPPAQNLRVFPQYDLLQVLGRAYYVGTLELHFPLLPDFGTGVYLQGLVGVDAGAIFNTPREALAARQASGVLGVNLLLGPLALQLHFARPFDIGTPVLNDRWLTFFTIFTPFLTF
ncbi:MAG: outer membrane protein assembly factor [Myxococcaceae bacterium]|nr:outer membrane protein assembly factor [Myxococcaceae bacterium]